MLSVRHGGSPALGAEDNGNRNVKNKRSKHSSLLDGADLSSYEWVVFSGESVEVKKKERDRKVFPLILIICIVFLLLSFLLPEGEMPSLERAETGGSDKSVDLSMSFEYGGTTLEKDVNLTVRAYRPSGQEALELIDQAEREIAEELRTNGLSFPESWGGCVDISWENEGFTYIGIDGEEALNFIAQLSCGEYTRLCEFSVRVTPTAEKYMESLEAFSSEFADRLNDSSDGRYLVIPGEENGVNISWEYRSSDGRLLAVIGLFIGVLLYFSRYDGIRKELSQRAEDFRSEVSNMSLQLILLLNCGLVAESAFYEIAIRNRDNPNPLYRAFADIRSRAEASNRTFSSELYDYAKTTGDRDFIRFATLVAEHSESGSRLCDKLEQERNRLYQDRLGRAKVKAGQAETKLCFPLMLLLIILIVITICPALMKM